MPKNRIILACAGARKTSDLVEEALHDEERRVLLLTYTNDNSEQIRTYIEDRRGYIPPHITVTTWFRWLLHECVRPYQNYLIEKTRVRTIYFEDIPAVHRYVKRTEAKRYYLLGTAIYRDRVSDFAVRANQLSSGRVISRLERLYDVIMLDEVQDLAGYDLELLDLLLESQLSLVAVGDPRQSVLRTNRSQKNKHFAGLNIVKWFLARQDAGSLVVETKNECYRSNQAICDFADTLYPELPRTYSRNPTVTGHDGIVYITPEQVAEYYRDFQPMVLRYNKDVDSLGLPAQNFGACKGRTYPRTLIFPTSRMLAFLETGDLSKAGDREKFYVAVTRAQYSVAFVVPSRFSRLGAA